MKLTEILNLDELELAEAMTGPEFYNQLTSPEFKSKDTFNVTVPFKIDNKKVDLQIPIKLEMDNLDQEVEQYLKATPELKKKFDTYAYWYDNFNKLVFGSMPENDACLFLAACAYCSANTALDQNILEAAKLFSAVKADMALPNGKQTLDALSTNVKDNMNNETLAYLKTFQGKGSKYADLLAPKKDYKGGTVDAGARKGQDDVFSEITVSNAKIPNFNLFVKYYLANEGNITKDQLFNDLKSGKFKIGGTKINSFFINLIFPGYKWNDKIDPATVDRWMIRVFFDKPLARMVEEDVSDWIQRITDQSKIKVGKKDTEETLLKKKQALLQKNKNGIVNAAIMQLFGSDEVRQNLVKILNEAGQKMGLTSYQLQALAWVNIRIRYKEPAAKFAKFEDVMDYAQEAAKGILQLDPNINGVMNTIKVLASGPRFKFKRKQDVIDTIQNRDAYQNVYYLPPKNDVEEKAKKKAAMADVKWGKMKVAVKDNNQVDIYDMDVSKKTPVHTVQPTDRKSALSQALRWILSYNPTPATPAAAK
jgi:hypothetical protein